MLDRPIESETAKIVENSYRAAILAFMDEWSLFAERNGVDLKKVIEAIKVRPTHSNIMFPGPGIGGYCLPKDGGLGVWAYRHILGWEDELFKATPQAIDINDTRALHVPQLVRDALRNMGLPIAAADVLVLGASYREDVGDTRYSGVELIVRRLAAMGASPRVHDPYLEVWPEMEESEEGHGNARFFTRQEGLRGLRIEHDLWAALKGIKALVLAVRHKEYLELDPEAVVRAVGGRFAVVDCFCILDDRRIERYFELGCEVKGMGRGHIQRIKEKVRSRRRIRPAAEAGLHSLSNNPCPPAPSAPALRELEIQGPSQPFGQRYGGGKAGFRQALGGELGGGAEFLDADGTDGPGRGRCWPPADRTPCHPGGPAREERAGSGRPASAWLVQSRPAASW